MSFTMMRAGASLRAFSVAFALVAVLPVSNVFAAGGSGSSGGGGGGDGSENGADRQKTDLTTCERGKVWDAKAHKCLPRHSQIVPPRRRLTLSYRNPPNKSIV